LQSCFLAAGGADGVPTLTDPARARREPQLAVLSVMAHGRGELMTAAAIGAVAAKAVRRLGPKGPRSAQITLTLLRYEQASAGPVRLAAFSDKTGRATFRGSEPNRLGHGRRG